MPGASLLGLGRARRLETEIGVLRSDRVADAMIDTLALGVQLKTPAGNRARIFRARASWIRRSTWMGSSRCATSARASTR